MNRDERDADAAATIRACRAALAARGSSLIAEAIGRQGADIVEWRHYPDGEVYDPLTHVQYFYHRHPAGSGSRTGQPEDGGHFHLFVRGEGIPAGVLPMLFADSAVGATRQPAQSAPARRGKREEVCHLVAIAIDRAGEPTGLFTTNRWVTGETWYRAEDATRLIERIRFDHDRRAMLLDRWIAALVHLFEPEIALLLHRRDKTILDWRWRRPRSNVLEDPRLEITSSCSIDLEARLAAVEERAAAPAPIPAAWLGSAPAAADGWGR